MNGPPVTQCVYCGDDLPADQVTIDHVIPLARGGTDGFRNRAPACSTCNFLKGPLTAREFMNVRDDTDDLEALKRVVHAEIAARRPPPSVPGDRVATLNAKAEQARQQGVNEAHAAANRAAVAAAAARRDEAQARFREDLEVAKVGWAIEQERRRRETTLAEAARAEAQAEGRKAGT